jgi:amino-acid N-acetyltransferase
MSFTVKIASESDIQPIYNLIKHYADEGVILERSINDIALNINNFLVAVSGDKTIGCVTFHDYGNNLKEIRSLAVDSSYTRSGIGKLLLSEMIARINSTCKSKIFTLTYRPDFFCNNGFNVVPKSEFPEKIWKDCVNCKDRENCGETAMVYSG